jgi:hypothetical protein
MLCDEHVDEVLKKRIALPWFFESEFLVKPFDPQLGKNVPGLFLRVAAELPDSLTLECKVNVPFSVLEFEIPIISLFDHRAPLIEAAQGGLR